MKLLRQTLFGTAVGALTVGGAMTIWACNRLQVAKRSNQVDRAELNQTIDRLNITAIVFYSVAAAAGISWLALKLRSRRSGRRAVAFVPLPTLSGMQLGLSGSFR